LEAGDLATMRAAFAIFESESERIGQPFNRWHVAYERVMPRMLDGDLDAAEQTATEALTLGSAAGQPDAVTFYGAQLLNVRHKQGRLHEVVPLIEQAAHDNPGLPVYRSVVPWAKSYDDGNREVSQFLDTEVANDFPMLADLTWLTAHALWADAAARTGHRPAAMALYERLLPWHDQFVTSQITATGAVAHYLGLLAYALDRHDEADQWFAQALAFHEQLEAPYFVAWTQTAWAALLVDRNQPGDTQRARALLDAALPVATERGYGYVERDARALLERIE
jgi:tetratricopeptide (TPR) repeat protein